MQRPFFSVEVLTYNQADYIAQTLDSILSQEHNYPYEIVIGDDYSTDGTRKILLEYKEKFPDIVILFLNKKNVGLIQNYFNVIKNCHGKYIMDCVGDDYWLPGKVKTQISFMERHPEAGICYGMARQYDQSKKRFLKTNTGNSSCSFDYLLNESIMSIPSLTVCFRGSTLFQYINEIQPESKKWLMEDLPQVLWFAKNSKIYFMNEVFAVYRIIRGSISHTTNIDKRIRFIDSEIEVRAFFSERYHIPFNRNDFENKKYFEYTLFALRTNNFALFRDNIQKIESGTTKMKLKQLIGKSRCMFSLYSYFWKIKNRFPHD